MVSVRHTRNDEKLTRLLWLFEDYTLLKAKVGYFNPMWEIYNKKQISIQDEIITKYKRKDYV